MVVPNDSPDHSSRSHHDTNDGPDEASRTTTALERARSLTAPVPNSTLYGEDEDAEFWQTHSYTIQRAWHEWDTTVENSLLPRLSRDHIDPRLRVAVESAWHNRRHNSHNNNINDQQDQTLLQEDEARLRDLWKPVAPGVYACPFLNPHKLHDLHRYLHSMDQSGIPTRRPNGMNRYGYIVEPSVDGAVNMTEFTRFYHYLVDDYIRPLGRLLFADYVGKDQEDDVESYAFTVRYKPGEDVALSEHSDASLYTLNVNLNMPPSSSLSNNNETDGSSSYQGSGLYFVQENDDNNKHGGATQRTLHNITFQPGMAVLHRGMTRHAALPITQGERTNLIVWVHGRHGYVRIAPYPNVQDQLSPVQRWTKVDHQKNQPSSGQSADHKSDPPPSEENDFEMWEL